MESDGYHHRRNHHEKMLPLVNRTFSLSVLNRSLGLPLVKRSIKVGNPSYSSFASISSSMTEGILRNKSSMTEGILNDLKNHYHLTDFSYNSETVSYKRINVFNLDLLSRNTNDISNKTRENIIGAIINGRVPPGYFIIDKWMRMKRAINAYLTELNDEEKYARVECVHKAGRKHNYDFLITFYSEDGTQRVFTVEFKFNASSIDKCPQFVQPMNPSQYMSSSSSYEEYYYDKYLSILSKFADLALPTREIYLQQIHSTSPNCMKSYQDLYYNGCKASTKFTGSAKDIEFYNLANEISRDSIKTFIENPETSLDINRLSSYLNKSQQGKIYMFYYNGVFILEHTNMDERSIVNVTKNSNKFRFECVSKTGKKNNVLLRWKNGNGIAFPAFQIS